MSQNQETGIEQLRKVVKLFDACHESFNDRFTIPELVKIAQAHWSSEWDLYLDEWEERQIQEAIEHGRAPDFEEVKTKYGTKLMAKYQT